MHVIDIIIIAIIVILAVYLTVRAWKNRGKCCHGCSICSEECSKQSADNRKQNH